MSRARTAPHLVRAHKVLTIKDALEWAFATERARLDFDDDRAEAVRPGVSPLWTVLQRGSLGCKIDGGGWNPPAADADTIARAVAHVPRELGGRGMALRIAELSRAGQAEDWGSGLASRCIPVGWKAENQRGPQAVTVLVGYERVEVNGRVRDFEVRACPVTYTATAARIASARAAWCSWRNALAWLSDNLSAPGALDRVTIAPGLPEAEPWKRG